MISFIMTLIPLAIAVTSLYLYQRSDHEVMKVLTLGSTAVAIIWGFATAHWGLHLLCLCLLTRLKFPLQLKPVVIDQ
ncbi:hypothetical protein FLX56_19855 [Synechococcus moorigangaii CMS01]|nr:hypothetical protein [Synechococcus moorigangaii CMS01]